MKRQTPIKLSICITTFNRAALIGETLDSILAQITEDCEIVILDAASTDGTSAVLAEYVSRSERLRYVTQGVNNGFDRDCDRVVELADGEYCWLMTDDDLLKPGAIDAVLHSLKRAPCLVVVNKENRDFSMSRVLSPRVLDVSRDIVYGPEEMDLLFEAVGEYLKYVGGVVIQRALWLQRERSRYYGSLYIHVGVIFQKPLPGESVVISSPLISYRRGNSHSWSPSANEIVLVKWPSLVGSLAISQETKNRVKSAEPWKSGGLLLLLRAAGFYSFLEYWKWIRPQVGSFRQSIIPTLIAVLPGALVNVLFITLYSLTGRLYVGGQPDVWVPVLRESRYYAGNWAAWMRRTER